MWNPRKLLIALGALLVPAASAIVVGSPAMLAGAAAPVFPVACKFTATVTFTPPLTMAGTVSTNKTATTTMLIQGGHFSGCLSAAPTTSPTKGTDIDQAVMIPATKLAPRSYATGYCKGFLSAAVKALRGLTFDITWTGPAGTSVFVASKVSTTENTANELGLVLDGKQSQGSYSEKSINEIVEYFDSTTSAALNTGCALNQSVGSATIDVANSVAIL